MSSPDNTLRAFGEFVLDLRKRVLMRNGEFVQLPPKALDVLVVLVEHAGTLVEKDELLRRVWPDTFVEEGNLAINVFTLRKALGDGGEQWIKTVRSRGYCFVGPVTRPGSVSQPAEPAQPADVPEAAQAAQLGPAQTAQFAGPPQATGASADFVQALGPAPSATRRWNRRLVVAAALALAIGVGSLSYVGTSRQGHLTVPGQVQSLAVLPFSATGGENADADLGPGLAAVLSGTLAHLRQVIVRPFASTAKYVGTTIDTQEVGRALKADVVLQGSVDRAGETVIVSATLVRVGDGARLWERTFSDTFDNLPQVERSLASDIARVLEPAVSPEEGAAIDRPGTANAEAFAAYAGARAAGAQMNPRDMAQAIGLMTRATTADGNFAQALSGLAAFLTLPINTASTPESDGRAADLARRALALNPRLAEPHTVLARVAVVRGWDWASAEDELKQALALSPYDAEPHLWYAVHLSANGRHDEALAQARFALQVDPSSPRLHLYSGMLHFMARRFDDADAQLRAAPLEMGATALQLYLASALAQVHRGRVDQAMTVLDRVSTRAGNTAQWVAHHAYLLTAAGRNDEADAALARLASMVDAARPPHVVAAAAAACRGRMDDAFDRLDRAVAEGDSRVVFLNVDPILDCARGDARFPRLVKRLRLDVRP